MKRILSLLLVMAMTFEMLPLVSAPAQAAEEEMPTFSVGSGGENYLWHGGLSDEHMGPSIFDMRRTSTVRKSGDVFFLLTPIKGVHIPPENCGTLAAT